MAREYLIITSVASFIINKREEKMTGGNLTIEVEQQSGKITGIVVANVSDHKTVHKGLQDCFSDVVIEVCQEQHLDYFVTKKEITYQDEICTKLYKHLENLIEPDGISITTDVAIQWSHNNRSAIIIAILKYEKKILERRTEERRKEFQVMQKKGGPDDEKAMRRNAAENSHIVTTRLCQKLEQINRALRRAQRDNFHICEDCGEEIPINRLEVSVSPFCVNCLAERERRNR